MHAYMNMLTSILTSYVHVHKHMLCCGVRTLNDGNCGFDGRALEVVQCGGLQSSGLHSHDTNSEARDVFTGLKAYSYSLGAYSIVAYSTSACLSTSCND